MEESGLRSLGFPRIDVVAKGKKAMKVLGHGNEEEKLRPRQGSPSFQCVYLHLQIFFNSIFLYNCIPVAPAPVLRDRSPGPTDRVRPCLRLPGAGRRRAGREAFPTGAGDGGTGGPARPGQEDLR